MSVRCPQNVKQSAVFADHYIITIIQSDATDVTVVVATVTVWRRLEGKPDQRVSAHLEAWPWTGKTTPADRSKWTLS